MNLPVSWSTVLLNLASAYASLIFKISPVIATCPAIPVPNGNRISFEVCTLTNSSVSESVAVSSSFSTPMSKIVAYSSLFLASTRNKEARSASTKRCAKFMIFITRPSILTMSWKIDLKTTQTEFAAFKQSSIEQHDLFLNLMK